MNITIVEVMAKEPAVPNHSMGLLTDVVSSQESREFGHCQKFPPQSRMIKGLIRVDE
jgi:hypothetical protein